MSDNEPPDVIGMSYDLAEAAYKQGKHAEAEGFESIGRMWYLIGKQKLGVPLDDDEKAEVAAFIAKHPPAK